MHLPFKEQKLAVTDEIFVLWVRFLTLVNMRVLIADYDINVA